MVKTEKRCRIQVPYWRLGEIESWLEGMLEQGWELAGVKDEKALFRKSDPQSVRYYCRIFDSINEESYFKRMEARKKEIDLISASGWTHIATAEEVGIFRSEKECPRIEIEDAEKEVNKLLKIYKNSANSIYILFAVNTVMLALNVFSSIYLSSFNKILATVVFAFSLLCLIFALFRNRHIKNGIRQHGLEWEKHGGALNKR